MPKVSVTFDGEQVGFSETISGDAEYAVLEAESFEVNEEAASVIFDASTAIVNGEVFRILEERATVLIYGEYVKKLNQLI